MGPNKCTASSMDLESGPARIIVCESSPVDALYSYIPTQTGGNKTTSPSRVHASTIVHFSCFVRMRPPSLSVGAYFVRMRIYLLAIFLPRKKSFALWFCFDFAKYIHYSLS